MMEQPRLTVPVGPHDHVRGPADAPVTLVEYGDYECPYCGRAYPVVKRLEQAFGDQLRFVFRNFPLTQSHPHAEQAAEAAEAAGAQGKFWQMHDMIYEHQQALTTADLRHYAAVLGLNQREFDQALRQHTYADRVREDFMSGIRSGVNGTPTFFINGVRYDGPADFDSMSAAIQQNASGVRSG
jgi:protein-disulfide isomerase